MYVNPLHQLTDREELFALITSHPLGAWVCQGEDGLIANHVPFFLDRNRGPLGTLIGHVSRANAVCRELGVASPSVVMFQGPQSYISPGWYPGKHADGKVVPTWNYVVAHVHGVARAIEDRDWMLDVLNQLTDFHEAGRPQPWSVADAPSEFIERMMRAIVGIEMPIDRPEIGARRVMPCAEAWREMHDSEVRAADALLQTLTNDPAAAPEPVPGPG